MLNDDKTPKSIKLQLPVLKDIRLVKVTYDVEGSKHIALEAQYYLTAICDYLTAEHLIMPR